MLRPAGKRPHKIAFQRGEIIRSPMGIETVGNWRCIAHAFSAVMYGTGSERRQTATELASQSATFVCNQTPTLRTVTERDRILFNCREWDIFSIALIDRNTIEFTANVLKG